MTLHESESVELKEAVVGDIKKETDGDRFEAIRSLNQELTFEATKKEFALRGVDFGSQQMNEVYDFIDFRNQTHATIEKLLRIDVRDYPEIAVKEALLNLLVHRNYSFTASALIRIYADRIEFASIGGLVSGLEIEDITLGISVCRNQNLANVFYRLHLIAAYGTGMGKIMKAYEGMEKQPTIETTKNAFKIILPNINVK